jgi:transposase-like protein
MCSANILELQPLRIIDRRHNISSNTIHGWIRSIRKRGSVKPLPRNDAKRILEIEKRLKDVSRENNTLDVIIPS